MKTKLLLVCIFNVLTIIAYNQSIIADQKNAATNTRTVTTGSNPLYKSFSAGTLQVQSSLETSDNAVVNYQLTVLSSQPDNNFLPSSCVLTDDANNEYNGVLQTESDTSLSTSSNKKLSYKFSKDDFMKIINAQKITSLQLTSDSGESKEFPINKNLQNEIINQAKVLLATVKIKDAQTQ